MDNINTYTREIRINDSPLSNSRDNIFYKNVNSIVLENANLLNIINKSSFQCLQPSLILSLLLSLFQLTTNFKRHHFFISITISNFAAISNDPIESY
jgi:hypothetical protein